MNIEVLRARMAKPIEVTITTSPYNPLWCWRLQVAIYLALLAWQYATGQFELVDEIKLVE